MSIETGRESFVRPASLTRKDTVKGVNRAVYTLFVTPEHAKLHAVVADTTRDESQPLHPDIAALQEQIHAGPIQNVDKSKKREMNGRELSQLAGVLVQFTDYVPTLQGYAQTPYTHIRSLYDAVVDQAASAGTALTLSEQLDISLQQTNGDLTEALWRLFMTSRQHARWLDTSSISGVPDFSREEKVDQMTQWQKSIAAFKTNADGPQDAAGDTYYAWTHALAGAAYWALPARPTRRTALAARTFERGTELMHKIVHRRNPQAVVNDHSIAAAYGNAIGKLCAETLTA